MATAASVSSMGIRKYPARRMPRFEPKRAAHGFAQRDAQVLDGVVLIHVEVALGNDVEVHRSVPRDELQHVIEETNAGGHAGLPRPSRFTRRRMSVSVVVRRNVARLIANISPTREDDAGWRAPRVAEDERR